MTQHGIDFFPDAVFDSDELHIIGIAVTNGIDHKILEQIKIDLNGFRFLHDEFDSRLKRVANAAVYTSASRPEKKSYLLFRIGRALIGRQAIPESFLSEAVPNLPVIDTQKLGHAGSHIDKVLLAL